MKVNFGNWLRTQYRRNDPVGDLARDFKSDPRCRRMYGYKRVRAHLEICAPTCANVFLTLDRAVAEWRQATLPDPDGCC